MTWVQTCLSKNAQWQQNITKSLPNLIPSLSNQQHPQVLWIGCSDSRVPETTILGAQPGDVFVHRNIANTISNGDISSSAVLTYAVSALKVKHVVVCGHTDCGGIKYSLGWKEGKSVLDKWVEPIVKSRDAHAAELDKLEGTDKIFKMVSLNVEDQIKTLEGLDFVSEAIKAKELELHGWVYCVETGLIKVIS